MATATKAVLAGLLGALEAAMGGPRPGGPVADVFARYDGEPSDAVDEHVADLRGREGASVLVGFLSDDEGDRDEAGTALDFVLRPSVVVVVRRSPRSASGAVAGATADAERLDDLYDEAALALAEAGYTVRRGRALAGDTRDWFGRALVAEAARDFPPGHSAGSGATPTY